MSPLAGAWITRLGGGTYILPVTEAVLLAGALSARALLTAADAVTASPGWPVIVPLTVTATLAPTAILPVVHSTFPETTEQVPEAGEDVTADIPLGSVTVNWLLGTAFGPAFAMLTV